MLLVLESDEVLPHRRYKTYGYYCGCGYLRSTSLIPVAAGAIELNTIVGVALDPDTFPLRQGLPSRATRRS